MTFEVLHKVSGIRILETSVTEPQGKPLGGNLSFDKWGPACDVLPSCQLGGRDRTAPHPVPLQASHHELFLSRVIRYATQII